MKETEKTIENLNTAKIILCNQQMLTSEMCVRIGQAITDAIALLEEKEVVEPIMIDHIVFGTNRKCSKCNQYLFPAGGYCPHCGRTVKWDD